MFRVCVWKQCEYFCVCDWKQCESLRVCDLKLPLGRLDPSILLLLMYDSFAPGFFHGVFLAKFWLLIAHYVHVCFFPSLLPSYSSHTC